MAVLHMQQIEEHVRLALMLDMTKPENKLGNCHPGVHNVLQKYGALDGDGKAAVVGKNASGAKGLKAGDGGQCAVDNVDALGKSGTRSAGAKARSAKTNKTKTENDNESGDDIDKGDVGGNIRDTKKKKKDGATTKNIKT